jgi:PASTA domain/CARDB
MTDVAVEAVGGTLGTLASSWLGQGPALIGLVVGAVLASRIEPRLAASMRLLKGSRPAAPAAPDETDSVGADQPSPPAPTTFGLVPVEPPPAGAPPPEPTPPAPGSGAENGGRRARAPLSSLLVTGTAVLIVILVFTVIELTRGGSIVGGRETTFGVQDVENIGDMSEADVVIPDVAGRNEDQARALLLEKGFEVAVEREFSDTEGEGVVTRTDPAARERVAKGSTVTMFVSTGIQEPLPDLTIELQQDCSLVPGGALTGEDQLTIFYRIENVGTGAHDDKVKVRAVSDTGEKEDRITGVSTSTAASFSQLKIHPEDYGTMFQITVTVDPDLAIEEENDENNSAVLTVQMPSVPSRQPMCT